MKNKRLDVVFVIDKSGSMSGSEDNTISSFNEYIERVVIYNEECY